VIARRFCKSIIRSKQRLTYKQAIRLIKREKLEGVPAWVVAALKELNDLAQQLRQGRFAKHALDLNLPECEIVLGDDGRMSGIQGVDNDESHQLVEECMVAANEAIAQELSNRHIRYISRLHEPPAENKPILA
jgi:ribonuclease R